MCSLVGTFINEKMIDDDLGSCHSCDPVKERLEHNGRCPCCEVIYHSFSFQLRYFLSNVSNASANSSTSAASALVSAFIMLFGNVKYFLILTVGSKKCLRETRIIFGRQIFSDCSGLSALTFRSVDDLEHTQCIVFSDRKRCVLVVGPQFIDKYFTKRIKKKR